ncbi:MAG: hypothetical protein IJS63_13270 [Bacteroidaceae bacterium]|nr:hypothetical protein [Bacteroidaceae bacterium]
MKHLMTLLLLLTWAQMGLAQVPLEFAYSEAEKEDSVSALAITPLKPAQTRKLLKRVIKQFRQDFEQEHDVVKYHIDATFNRDSLAPFSVRAAAGFAFDSYASLRMHEFKYEGPYRLNHADTAYICNYLETFLRLSPNYVPPLLHLDTSFHGPIDKGPLLPFEKYGETVFYYNVTAYSIVDAAGRSIYRIVFARNGEKRIGIDHVYGKKYDVGELTGTAYFDCSTLHMTQFKGNARLMHYGHVIRIRYQNDYDENKGKLVLRQTKIVWESKGTKIRAAIHRLNE